jgi:hypothetical protein
MRSFALFPDAHFQYFLLLLSSHCANWYFWTSGANKQGKSLAGVLITKVGKKKKVLVN